jgi:hypothetical protein
MYKDTSLPAVLYKRETWFLSLGTDRSKGFVNGVLKRIYGHRREEVTGGWTKLYVETLHDVDSSSVIRLICEEV